MERGFCYAMGFVGEGGALLTARADGGEQPRWYKQVSEDGAGLNLKSLRFLMKRRLFCIGAFEAGGSENGANS